MWPVAIVVTPLAVAACAWATPSNRWRPLWVPFGAALHLLGTLVMVARPWGALEEQALGGWLAVDALTRLFLLYLSVFFFVCSLYVPAYLALRTERSNRVFCANLLAALGAMSLVIFSHHLGLMWVGMETTTLVSAPSLYFNHNPRSLEATWKYLLVGSTGIALALLGSLFLAYSAVYAGVESSLLFEEVVAHAPRLSPAWLQAGFVLLFVGYGTKMGLAPMHTWKPDAYGEAPGVVGALLAGGVTSCAFLAILRVYRVCESAGQGAFARELMVFMGLLSMAVAAVFMVRQRDFKRMLAYSSVEHMGILVLGIGLGGAGVFGALLHLLNNGFTKAVLFLAAGNIHRAYGSKHTDDVYGALRRVPLSGAMLLAGFLAITGAPPFGPFLSEFTIANAAIGSGQFLAGGLYLIFLGVVFVGMGATVLRVVQGDPPANEPSGSYRDTWRTGVPLLIALGLVLLLGLYIPPPLESMLREAADLLETAP